MKTSFEGISNMERIQGLKLNKFMVTSFFYPGRINDHTFLRKARPIQTKLFWQDAPLHKMAAKSSIKRTLIVWLVGMFPELKP